MAKLALAASAVDLLAVGGRDHAPIGADTSGSGDIDHVAGLDVFVAVLGALLYQDGSGIVVYLL